MPVRWLIRVDGIVQGVGFRPFVHRLATDLGLTGHVGNDSAGVFIEAQGEPADLTSLTRAILERPPPLAVVEHLTTTDLTTTPPSERCAGFAIVDSDRTATPSALISADFATCADCLRELFDPADRRYRYPFINCTNCGPRFTIVTGIPYDRPNTTMAGFPMCASCRREYDDPVDRRFHAQPVCCAECGPALSLRSSTGPSICSDDVIETAARLLLDGAVVAVKGLGGYHLAAVADNADAVANLRHRKHREDKPFAVMCADLASAASLVVLDGVGTTLLTGPQRPIVLLPRRDDASLPPDVAPGSRRLGVMLPYAPLHHLLVRAVGRPLVLTSGNVSDEPIAYRDADALERLSNIADAFLLHDRPIHIRTDDSVLRVSRSSPLPIRRSRGYAPAPLRLPVAAPRPVLGCGAELKSTFALGRGDRVFVSHHIGDLENAETLRSFTDGIDHFRRLFAIDPQVVVHDLHPDYLSTKWALDLDGVELLGVQHHHAHIASCLADNGVRDEVIGVAFDGLGYGTDGTLWGGELLLADLTQAKRAMHLEQVPMPGGAQAIREPWRMALAWLRLAYDGQIPDRLAVKVRNAPRWDAVAAVAGSAMSPLTSSVGRLFDAVAALCGIRDGVNYEGQAAIELEQVADGREPGHYPMSAADGLLRASDLVRAVADDLQRDVSVPVVAARFHRGLALGTEQACAGLREATGVGTVALSGGVFQNELFVATLVGLLETDGFRVLTHRQVPPNDGGISLGQVAVAAARELRVPS